MSTTLQAKPTVDNVTRRLSEMPLSSVANVLQSFACNLTDEQLAKEYRAAMVAEKALRLQACRDGSTATLQKMIAEQEFIHWLSKDILLRRNVSMVAVSNGDI